jgi:Txe/YoeB family toxin of Txe-Axe toxin-antitoxin module
VVQVDDNPHVAADDDLIEKEWVEKAKRVISETKNDPFAQEQAVSRLQADYLQKRYGKVIQLPERNSWWGKYYLALLSLVLL